MDLDSLEEATRTWLRQRQEFAALPEERRRAPGVPAFWHSSRLALDMLEPEGILKLIGQARAGQAAEAQVEALRVELAWIGAFAQMRSADDSKTFAKVNRGALRTIAERALAALSAPAEVSDFTGQLAAAQAEERKGDMASRDHAPTLRASLESLLAFADTVVSCQESPHRGDWGVECPLCMGELVEQADRDVIAKARAALASSTPESA